MVAQILLDTLERRQETIHIAHVLVSLDVGRIQATGGDLVHQGCGIVLLLGKL